MKKIFFLAIIFFLQSIILYARCSSGFITLEGKLLDQYGNPVEGALIFGFINNSNQIFYSKDRDEKLSDKTTPCMDIEDELIYSKSQKDGSFKLKLFFDTWSWVEGISYDYCYERIRRIDIISLKEGYYPIRKVVLPIKEGIKINVIKLYKEEETIKVGEIIMTNIEECKKLIEDIIMGRKRKAKWKKWIK